MRDIFNEIVKKVRWTESELFFVVEDVVVVYSQFN